MGPGPSISYGMRVGGARSGLASEHAGGSGAQPGGKPLDLRELEALVSKELVASQVGAEAAQRRAELTERERDRIQRSLSELQVRTET